MGAKKRQLIRSSREKQSLCSKRRLMLLVKRPVEERWVEEILKKSGVRFMAQKGFIAGDYFCFADFYLPFSRVCLEIDGGYHNSPEQVKRDKRKNHYLINKRKFTVIRIPNICVHNYKEKLAQLFKSLRVRTPHLTTITEKDMQELTWGKL